MALNNSPVQRLREDQIDIAFYRSAPADGAGLKLAPPLNEPMIMAIPMNATIAMTPGLISKG